MGNITIVTPKGRLAFPSLYEKKQLGEGKAKYRCILIYDKKQDLSELKKAIDSALSAKFGPRAEQVKKSMRSVIKDGDEKPQWAGFPGNVYIQLTSDYPIKVVDAKREEIFDPDIVYSGCYCKALIEVAAYDTASKGVGLYFKAIQKVAEGERLAGGVDVMGTFTDESTNPDY